jgi:hypothetical protein
MSGGIPQGWGSPPNLDMRGYSVSVGVFGQ